MKITITKGKTDPICLRASIGGDENIGYYIVYKGDEKKIEKMLIETLEAFKKVKK